MSRYRTENARQLLSDFETETACPFCAQSGLFPLRGCLAVVMVACIGISEAFPAEATLVNRLETVALHAVRMCWFSQDGDSGHASMVRAFLRLPR
jgi:hypothetical protein